MTAERPRVLFLGSGYAGHHTRFLNLQHHVEQDQRIDPSFRLVSGWREGGWIERMPLANRGMRGRMRASLEAAALASLPRPAAFWVSAGTALTPYLWSQVGPLRRPLVLDFDWTVEQREAWASVYFDRKPRSGRRLAMALWQERLLWSRTSLFTPWSAWAAAPVLKSGVDRKRVRVIPPGVDLSAWATLRSADTAERPLRLLFVGGDLGRKGGEMLADLVRGPFAGRCELDLVTHGELAASPSVRVHRAAPNSPELRDLYQRADVFVMPTKADCFGIATIEAMASGLPVIVSDLGAAREIVDDGETGWLISSDAASLRLGIERALSRRDALPAMGRRGRTVAEERFDGERNDRLIVDVMVDEIGRAKRGSSGRGS